MGATAFQKAVRCGDIVYPNGRCPDCKHVRYKAVAEKDLPFNLPKITKQQPIHF
jgi:hypothetical protein